MKSQKQSNLEIMIDKIYTKLKLVTMLIGFGVLPISFMFKYFNVAGACIVFLLTMVIIALIHGIYKAFLYPDSFHILSPDMPSYKPNKKSNYTKTPSTAGAIASDLFK